MSKGMPSHPEGFPYSPSHGPYCQQAVARWDNRISCARALPELNPRILRGRDVDGGPKKKFLEKVEPQLEQRVLRLTVGSIFPEQAAI